MNPPTWFRGSAKRRKVFCNRLKCDHVIAEIRAITRFVFLALILVDVIGGKLDILLSVLNTSLDNFSTEVLQM